MILIIKTVVVSKESKKTFVSHIILLDVNNNVIITRMCENIIQLIKKEKLFVYSRNIQQKKIKHKN